MALASDVHGKVFRNGTATLLARIQNASAEDLTQASVDAIVYSVLETTPDEPNTLTPVTGHDDVALSKTAVVFNTLQTDDAWTVDEEGYNFRHEIDVSTNEVFATAGASYQVRYEITPVSGQKIVFRFLLRCI